MSHQLTFEQLVNYDAGQPGITVDVALKAYDTSVTCQAKLDTGSKSPFLVW